MIRIAIIDDEPRQRRGMEQLIIALRPEAEVLAFRNAKEALEALRVQPAQIIFSDIRMPHMTGLDLAQRVHERMPNTLVILISAYSEFEYAHKAIELGVFSYLLKPIQRRYERCWTRRWSVWSSADARRPSFACGTHACRNVSSACSRYGLRAN